MRGRTTPAVAVLAVTAVAACAFGAGYIERFDTDPGGFQNYEGDWSVIDPDIWVDDVNGNPGGHIYGGLMEYGWRAIGREMIVGEDPLSGPHNGEALVLDAKGRLHCSKGHHGVGLVIVAECEDESEVYHGWVGYFMYTEWNSDVPLGDENTWMRAILPTHVDAPTPHNLSGVPAPLAWHSWTEAANMVNGNPQDDLEFTLATTEFFGLYGTGSLCYLDNIGYTNNGDANGDGEVGIADLSALADNYGATGNVFWTQGDFNTDLKVGIADLSALADNYGLKTLDLSQTVPEPATLGLLAGGAAAALLRRRR